MLCPIKAANPDSPAVSVENIIYSYKELDLHIEKLCFQLKNQGICLNDRIALIPKGTYEEIALFFATLRLKAIFCPLSFRLPPKAVEEALQRLEPKLLWEPQPTTDRKVELFDLEEEQIASLLFTSGSSGKPKIACHSLGNHLQSALASNQRIPLSSQNSWRLSLPLFHVGGIAVVMRCALSGACIQLGTSQAATHLSLVPTQLRRLLQTPALLQSKKILVGGAALPPSLFFQAKAAGLNVYSTYGMTETSSQIATDLEPEVFSGTLSCGKTLSHLEVSLAEDGEILVRGTSLFQGYWDKEKGCTSCKNPEGWFATKDLGAYTPDGRLLILGRKDRLFISGGENIQPEEIEQALLSLEGILEARVVPIPDPEFGMRPAAHIYDESGKHTLESLRERLKERLPSYKLPVCLLPLEKDRGKLS